MEKISVVVPSYNNIKGLIYLLEYFSDKDYPVVVVLNDKNQAQKIKFKNKNFLFLPQEKNLGFAGAVNLAGEYIKTDWMLILNDDIIFKNKKSIIEDLIKYAKKDKLDAVSPILINPKGEIENVGYKVLPYGRIELVKEFKGLRVQKLDGLTAACLLIKTLVFKKLKGFDERFFAYLEDVDFFIRFKKEGFKMGVAPLTVVHHHMTTSKTMGSFKARQDLVNWWRLYFKHRDVFKLNLKFLIERFKNLSGYLKAIRP